MSGDTEDSAQADWEGEGGAPEPEPKQTTLKGQEIPVPERASIFAAFKKVIPPVRKP